MSTNPPSPAPVTLTTSDDVSLEAKLHRAANPVAAIVATHPHPLYGGDMNNTAPAALARELPGRGISVLRFNFRGVGASDGVHGDGVAEIGDVTAAIDGVTGLEPDVPIVLVGYSFGADVALGVDDDRLAGWVAIAAPLRILASFPAAHDARPVHLLVPAHDQFRDPASAATATADWTNTTMAELPGTDHFLMGQTARIVDEVEAFVSGIAARS